MRTFLRDWLSQTSTTWSPGVVEPDAAPVPFGQTSGPPSIGMTFTRILAIEARRSFLPAAVAERPTAGDRISINRQTDAADAERMDKIIARFKSLRRMASPELVIYSAP